MDELKLVPMAPHHLDDLVKLEQLCFSQPWTRAGLAAELSSETAVFVVAQYHGQTAGYAGMHCVCGECYVDNIAVFPAFRRKGIGRALTQELIARAKQQNAEFLSLEVRPSNTAAYTLYESLGLQPAGRRKNFYRSPTEDALILTLFFQKS